MHKIEFSLRVSYKRRRYIQNIYNTMHLATIFFLPRIIRFHCTVKLQIKSFDSSFFFLCMRYENVGGLSTSLIPVGAFHSSEICSVTSQQNNTSICKKYMKNCKRMMFIVLNKLSIFFFLRRAIFIATRPEPFT